MLGLPPQGRQPRPPYRETLQPALPRLRLRLPCALPEWRSALMRHRTQPGPLGQRWRQRRDHTPAVLRLSSPLAPEGTALGEGSHSRVLRQ